MGKSIIYIGQDVTTSINYFGSASSKLIEKDFNVEERKECTIKKEIIWESETVSNLEGNQKEVEYINLLQSNNPRIGYNQCPKFKEV